MTPLLTLVVVTLLARLAGVLGVDYVGTWPDAVAVGLAAMFLLTASAHWSRVRREGLIAIVPRALPRPDLLVTVTGLLEILGAVGLLIPTTRVPAAIGLGVLLLVMYPANVRAARGVDHPAAPRTPLPARTAMQVLFVAATVLVATTS